MVIVSVVYLYYTSLLAFALHDGNFQAVTNHPNFPVLKTACSPQQSKSSLFKLWGA